MDLIVTLQKVHKYPTVNISDRLNTTTTTTNSTFL